MRIGIDIGGTKIEAVALDQTGRELVRQRTATPVGDYPGTVRTVTELVTGIEAELDRRASVGVGIPGSISPASGLVKNANSVWLIGRPFDRDLSEALGRPVRLANDANCLALSEAVDGAAVGTDVVFSAILGTGVGGGIVVNGKVLTGREAIAGEWGHNPLPWPRGEERPGFKCFCGLSGCIETFLSGPGFARDHQAHSGHRLEPAEIVQLADANDAQAKAAMKRYEDRLARALATVINFLDPDVIVLGGGMSNVGRLYRNVPRIWTRYVFSDRVDTPLVPPRHGDSSGVRGAAWLWPPEENPNR